MSKTCSKCNFNNNPDNAHFCGNCGASLFPYNYCWTVVDMYGYSRISDSELRRLRNIEKEYKTSPWNKFLKWIKNVDWEDVGWGSLTIIAPIVVVLLAVLFNDCGGEKEQAVLKRIEIDGKYGVGYDKDNMVVPAIYADISTDAYGNQWITKDETGKKGLAYVGDSVVNIIYPAFSDVGRLTNGSAILAYDQNQQNIAYRGKLVFDKTYDKISSPGYLGETFILMNGGVYELFKLDENKVINTTKGWWNWNDGALCMKASNGYNLYSYDGTLLVKDLYDTYHISDSMMWAFDTRQNYVQNRATLYNTKGERIKIFPKNSFGVPFVNFSDGIGWIRDASNKSKWIAIDRKGNELFTFYGEVVRPYTMGLAPVFRNMSGKVLMGMMDTEGNIVIPMKYTKPMSSDCKFQSDSTMEVKLDGKRGRLHRDGTFKPL